MSRFNGYLLGFICTLPLGLILLIIGVLIRDPSTMYSSTSLIILGIMGLALSAILLIAGLVKFGRTTF